MSKADTSAGKVPDINLAGLKELIRVGFYADLYRFWRTSTDLLPLCALEQRTLPHGCLTLLHT
jgi:hypothetical protein